MRAARTLLAVTAVLALASCGDVQWRKANGDDSMLGQDLTACRKMAMERTVRSGNSVPRTEISPVFGPTGAAPADVRMQETQAVTVCMRDKGYALVPVSAPR